MLTVYYIANLVMSNLGKSHMICLIWYKHVAFDIVISDFHKRQKNPKTNKTKLKLNITLHLNKMVVVRVSILIHFIFHLRFKTVHVKIQ